MKNDKTVNIKGKDFSIEKEVFDLILSISLERDELKKTSYDSRINTLLHIKRVNELLILATIELLNRANKHDTTKLLDPEKELFDKMTPKLKNCTYGSDEYKGYLKELEVALNHHYDNNSHHPEHYENGINDFDLFDLIEMFFDWTAATERHADGDIFKSIEINKNRFGISDQICNIFRNTANKQFIYIK